MVDDFGAEVCFASNEGRSGGEGQRVAVVVFRVPEARDEVSDVDRGGGLVAVYFRGIVGVVFGVRVGLCVRDEVCVFVLSI